MQIVQKAPSVAGNLSCFKPKKLKDAFSFGRCQVWVYLYYYVATYTLVVAEWHSSSKPTKNIGMIETPKSTNNATTRHAICLTVQTYHYIPMAYLLMNNKTNWVISFPCRHVLLKETDATGDLLSEEWLQSNRFRCMYQTSTPYREQTINPAPETVVIMNFWAYFFPHSLINLNLSQ